ncbi:methyltransferase domain-containing protein [Candidatus Thioglobus sp.]|nr:methyltransferase domain-containing protein [Candidatus Thioglobus sp.]
MLESNRFVINKFKNLVKETDKIFKTKKTYSYWPNLSKEQSSRSISKFGTICTKQSIKEISKKLTQAAFSSKHVAALELLQLNGTETVVDLGCKCGELSIPLAKQVSYVLGIDQTLEPLKFTEVRANENNLDNIDLICGNLREIKLPEDTFDLAVVYGGLEWLPKIEPIVADDFLYKDIKREPVRDPSEIHLDFLRNVHSGLKAKGRLFLSIENRYDYKNFFGAKNPHSEMHLTTVLPKRIANIVSTLFKKRDYRTWVYSFKELEELLKNAGFSNIQLHACWPDYRFPEHINEYGEYNQYFRPTSSRNKDGVIKIKRVIANRLEWLIFKKLNLQIFSPSIIAIAKK